MYRIPLSYRFVGKLAENRFLNTLSASCEQELSNHCRFQNAIDAIMEIVEGDLKLQFG